jgi:hypothetical protein
MQSACERWTSLPPIKKMLVNFQDMFTAAHEIYETLMTQAGGYNGANNAQMQETEKFYNETAEAFANLAMAATADKDLLSTLTNTDFTLTGQLAAKDKISVALQAQLRNSNGVTIPPNVNRPVSATEKIIDTVGDMVCASLSTITVPTAMTQDKVTIMSPPGKIKWEAKMLEMGGGRLKVV